MRPLSSIKGTPVPLLRDHVDTDQIIPAAFLKGVDREGLAEGLFHGWRFRPDGEPDPSFPLNHPSHQDARILLVGENFGCGSSREHAAWALLAAGFRVVIGKSFADIFRANAHRNGLLTVALSPAGFQGLMHTLEALPGTEVSVDLEAQLVTVPGGWTAEFTVDPFARHCILTGTDPLGHLLNHLTDIEAFESRRPAWARVSTGSHPEGGQ